jgi:hypothetical protein
LISLIPGKKKWNEIKTNILYSRKKVLMDVIATAKTQQQNTGYVSKRITVWISHYHPLKL